ncbi:MAG: alpha/beta hydrolase [Candidatus Competibacteraceae bacterium]|jgi:pimeloyl-ACP methyl ester carboxylesterase|nr:alpha/beta hydrolase [Candidatus Competibacteraceae bacterium]
MTSIIVERKQLFFERHNPDNPCNVVLIHGAGADRSHWPTELVDLPDCAVTYVDLPGHGRSAGPGKDSVVGYAKVVKQCVETLKLSRVVLFGHSMGGGIALTLALGNPPWLEALVLVGSGARLKILPALLEQVSVDYPAAVAAICQMMFGPKTAPELIAAEQVRYLKATDWRAVHDDFVACNNFDVMDRLSAISVPTLVVAGEDDTLTPVKYGEYLKESIPGAQLAVIPEAGHMLAREKPQEFFEVVGAFLESLSAVPEEDLPEDLPSEIDE